MVKPNASNRLSNERSRLFVGRALHPLLVIAFAFFGYLLWLHFYLFIKSNGDQYVPTTEVDNTPVTRVRKTASTNLKDLTNDISLKELAKDLSSLFSAEDGIISFDRPGFEISLPDQGSKSKCTCDIISADCLEMIECMTDMHNPQKRNAMAWMGTEIRSAMKANSNYETFRTHNAYQVEPLPLGKLLQYNTMGSWRSWRTRNIIYEYNWMVKSIFIDPSLYPDCQGEDNGKFYPPIVYNGAACFYQSPKAPEESAGTIIEDEAKRWYDTQVKNAKGTRKHIRKIWDNFFRQHRPLPKRPLPKRPPSGSEDDGSASSSDSSDVAAAEFDVDFSALGSLFLFAHLARIKFNRRAFLDEIYKEQLTAVVVPKSENSAGGGKNDNDTSSEDPFIVSLHMRRGDSCGNPDPNGYEKNASPLDSPPQMGGDRKCYQTEVYLRAVARVRELVPKARPLHVYLATDDVSDVMRDIFASKYSIGEENSGESKKKSEVTSDDLGVEKWFFLNITRNHFQQKSDTIEAPENVENQPKCGETAVTDLWLLSHGHAFVGHMGSRFGKVSWLLATARRNNFIPFFSVDGHSFCCEIDEHCAATKPFITVSNCLTFGHEYGEYDHERYWEDGSLARRERFTKDKHRREKRNKSRQTLGK